MTSPTLPAGEPPEHASESERQDLSAACAEAVDPIRRLMEVYRSGLDVKPPHDEVLSRTLGGASAVCGEEWGTFYTKELDGWLTP